MKSDTSRLDLRDGNETMIISLDQVAISYGAALVLKDVTVKVEDDSRIGLIGVNGAGKSTLLNIIFGEIQPDEGTIARGSRKRIGYLRQDSGLSGGTIREEMYSVFEHLFVMEREIHSLEQKIAGTDTNSSDYRAFTAEYTRLQERFEAEEGYRIDVKIATVLAGMGFGNIDMETPSGVLSGGERTRLAICKLLLETPDLLIMDEPTNHLDFRTLLWLEEYLTSYKGALLIVSHDRYFLDQLCTSVWEVEHHALSTYPGNYSRYLILKQERTERRQKEYESQRQEISDLKDFIARNLVRATTSNRAKSRRKALERMDLIEKPKLPEKPPSIRFECRRDPVKDVLHIKGMTLSVGEGEERKQLFSGIDLDLMRGEKVAMIGVNGVGKTSFLKAVLGDIPYEAGSVEWGRNTDVALFEQGEEGMDDSKTAMDVLWDAFPHEYEHTIRTMLGRVGLTGENVYKQVGQLSGGERARLKFARLIMLRGNVLMMDEPTNHLDLASKEALDKALTDYRGTLLVISHDRYLLNKFPDKIIEMHPGGLTTYPGRYDQYIAGKKTAGDPPPHQEQSPKMQRQSNTGYRTKKQRSEAVIQRRRIQELEGKIEALEVDIWDLEQEISLPEVASDYLQLQEKCELLEKRRLELDCTINEWGALSEESE